MQTEKAGILPTHCEQFAKEIRGDTFRTTTVVPADEFKTHFQKLLTVTLDSASFNSELVAIQVPQLDCPIELDEVYSAISLSKNLKTPAAFDNVDRNALFHKLSALGISTKMVDVIKTLYCDTAAAVWDGIGSTEFFSTNKGVRQGCVLSALLFVLFLNDLHAYLPVGLLIEGQTLNILLYADDIVLLSDNPDKLKQLINSFIAYCNNWNLKVNLAKSEIVIFRNGGRRAASEKWFFNDTEITVANHYKYLGVVFNYNMSWDEHLNNRLSSSKNSINSTWSKPLRNKYVQHSTKFKIYDAASRSIMLYCGQVWGYRERSQLEKLQRFFIKRCFLLPDNTPNYALHIETGLPKAFLTTLKLHFSYIRKTISLSNDRLPRILSEAVIRKSIFWAKEWLDLFHETWNGLHSILLCKLNEKHWSEATTKANLSQFHDEYCNFLYTGVPNYFDDTNPRDMISLIFKARCGLLSINERAFHGDTNGICTLCNLDASENTFHFIGICPIFKGYRLKFLGNYVLSHSQLLNILNGNCYDNLYLYLKAALKYRYLILNEFS
ncbi:uncharacterized protein LOC129913492 [Episyrphus balteatus]|uniref:uncharacterized protein LOC129913492 n=1 Tax=Episyrphus balteatus TaxID=286459 RepID=UPI00248531D2|nr:uncharacterized protein LOC129913492 [Episyrphus balteatus]